ncbi:MAG: TatD family hydrolase [Clostridiales bacterium]|nr:TatD family hydrolase [Clostridiales bacterium]
MYLDIHAHFADEGFDLPAEWAKIQAANVKKVVLAGDTVMHSRMHAEMCRSLDGAYFTAGVHPSEVDDYSKETHDALRELCLDKKCVAVGEIGLDYHYDDTDKEKQRAAFIAQIELAKDMGMPLQIHSRDACADTLAILREMREYLKRGFLMHCYSYGVEALDDFLSLGGYFSFGGVACFKNARRVVESVERCPLDKILTETDSPYLSPFRGEKNTPANIPVIARRLAEIKNIKEEELLAAIERNARTLFPRLI